MKKRLIEPMRIGFAVLLLVLGNLAGLNSWAAAVNPEDDVKSLGSTSSSERDAASLRLKKSGAVQPLLKGLDDSSEQVRIRSLWVLRQIRTAGHDIVASTIALKRHSENSRAVRIQMVQTLRDLPGPVALRELKGFASEDADEEVRWLALHQVGKMSRNESKFFRDRLTDKSLLVRLAAFTELAGLGDKSGRTLAIDTLGKSENEGERMEAMRLLGAVADRQDISLLKSLSESKIGHNAARHEAFCAYRHDELMQLSAQERLPALIKALDDRAEVVRDCAYIELYQSSDPATNEALKKYLGEPGHLGYKEARNALSSR